MRIMVWNIQFFTETRVNNPMGTPLEQQIAAANVAYITTTVQHVNPSIFIVIEPLSQAGNVGSLATGGGPDALRFVLTALRVLNANWCLVPPLKTRNRELDGRTYTETVGVFYRSDVLQFTGPYEWPAAQQANGPSVPAGGGAAANYLPPWNGTVPGGTQHAAQCQFFDNGNEVTFPNVESRRPVLTTFLELGGAGRIFKVFSCHTKPGTDARTATTRMMNLAEANPAPGEVSVFAGDFNVNFLNADLVDFAVIQALIHQWGFVPTIALAGISPTMYLRVGDATPAVYLRNLAVDEIWVKYNANVQPMAAPVGTVVNRVVDTPAIPRDMFNALAAIPGMGNPNDVFRQTNNFGHLGPPADGTSDHLPVFVDL